ncbi:MAG: phosphate uptake regulator PhoU [Thermoplasmata archaeon]
MTTPTHEPLVTINPPRRRSRTPPEPGQETTRFLQRMGAVTVGVSLPRAWMGDRGLAPGSAVRLRRLGDGSILVRDGRRDSASLRVILPVEPRASSEHLFRRLIGAYVRGANEFVLRESGGISAETRQVARTFARRTAQPEVVSDEGEELVLRDVSRGAQISIPQLLHRMFQLVVRMQRDAGAAWEPGASITADPFELRDDEVDRHAWTIERVLALRLLEGPAAEAPDRPSEETVDSLLLARSLERIADHAVTIALWGQALRQEEIPAAILRALSAYHGQVLDSLVAAFEVAEHPSAARANEVIDTGEALRSTHSTLTERFLARSSSSQLSPRSISSLGLLLQSLERTAAYTTDIAEIGLDRAIASDSVSLGLLEVPFPAPEAGAVGPRESTPARIPS